MTQSQSAELFARQRTVGLVGRIASEILGMVIVTARAAGSGARRDDEHLAEAACASTGRRLAGLWAELDAELAAPPVRDWLAGSAVDLLACPVDIDTDALMKTVRADSHGAVSERAATALARHWGAAQKAGRTALAVGGRRRQLLHRWAWCARSGRTSTTHAVPGTRGSRSWTPRPGCLAACSRRNEGVVIHVGGRRPPTSRVRRMSDEVGDVT